MKISCNVIGDLLPLYAEGLVSDDTKMLVDDHLCQCEDCANVLKGMKKKAPVMMETGSESLSKVKKRIRRGRLISVMAAVMTVITVFFAVITYLFAPFQLTMEQALDDFYIREDGAVVMDYSPYATGRSLTGWNENWFINQYSTRYDMWKGDNRKSLEVTFGTDGVITEEEAQRYEGIEILYGRWAAPDGSISSDADIPWRDDDSVVEWESEKNWWYSDPAGLGNDTLLHDAGKQMPEKEDRYRYAPVYPMLFFGGLGAALVMLVLTKKAGKAFLRELSARGMTACASLAFSTLFVSSGRIFTSDVGVIDQYWGWMIGMNTVLLTLAALFWRQLYLMNRTDREI